MAIRNDLLSLILIAIGGDPEPQDSRNTLLRKIIAQQGGDVPAYWATRNELLQAILDSVPVAANWSADSILITADSVSATADGAQ